MRRHITDEELNSIADGAVPSGSLLDVADHLQECAACAEHAARLVDLDALAGHVRHQLAAESEHPSQEQIVALVDGALDESERQWIEAHMESCLRCADDVNDLRAEQRAQFAPRSPWSWMRIAAGVVGVAALAGGVVWLRSASQPNPTLNPRRPGLTTTTAPPADPWSVLERSVLSAGTIDRPAVLNDLRGTGQPERGESSQTRGRLAPAGVVVESDRPEFRWTPTTGAHYNVTLFVGDAAVATSGRLGEARWQPPAALRRGETYLWQVEVLRHDGTSTVMPRPPAPEALFRIADGQTVSAIRAARTAHPADHLLLGILYARAGMPEPSLAELTAHLAQHPADARAAMIADSVRRW